MRTKRTILPLTSLALLLSRTTATTSTPSDEPVSLANFIPAFSSLPDPCHTIYTRAIPGCTAADFLQSPSSSVPPTCSPECVNGLLEITIAVAEACAELADAVPAESVLDVFLRGQGVQRVCPGVEVVTVSSGAGSAPTQRPDESSQRQQPATSTRTTTIPEETETRTASRTSTPTPSASNTGGIAIDTTIPTTLATSLPSSPSPSASSPPADPEEPPSFQKSNEDSGGGSPFDIQATGAGLSATNVPRWGFMAAALGVVAGVFGAL